jgi:alpha-D-xyloside xylohydrolase
MRPLVMDFNGDTAALNRPFEYMFGKAFLVAPVTEPGKSEWNVYLPKSVDWFDFWTGEKHNGGHTIKTAAPLDKIPLYVKTGSVIPMGKLLQYAGQKPADTLEIRIYPGADGSFELYEDEGDTYNYEKGSYSAISFIWNDAKKTLTIGERNGSFPGMIAKRTFKMVLVSINKGVGSETTEMYDRVISYKGKKEIIQF